MPQFDFPTAFASWRYGDGGPESAAIDRVLKSDRFTMGPEVAAFEEEFAAYHRRRHGIMVNSGSSANLIAVAAMMLAHPFRSAAVPAVAWGTTYAPLVQNGCDNLILCDIDQTWNAPAVHPTTHVYMICPVLGNPAYLNAWRIAALGRAAALIEDCCESLGAVATDGNKAGTFGTLSTFSFYYSHQISGIEGGMILTDDDGLALRCRLLRDHGLTRAAGEKPHSFDDEYDFRVMGYNLRPVEMHAAICREQLKGLDAGCAARRGNLDQFCSMAGSLPIRMQEMHGKPSPFALTFQLEDATRRIPLAKAFRAAGIDCRLPTGGSFRKHAYGARWSHQATPNADRLHEAGMFLGNAPWPIPRLVERAVAVMQEVL